MGVEEGLADDYTQDGTVDLKGNPVRRSKRGGWKACSFVVGISLPFTCIFLSNSEHFSIFSPFPFVDAVYVEPYSCLVFLSIFLREQI